MPSYTLKKRMVNGVPTKVKVFSPSRRRASSRITKPRFQAPGKAAKFIAVDSGQIIGGM
jgi:hypothetical protein